MALYDLTHPIEPGMPAYPGDPDVSVSPHATHAEEGYRVSSVAMGTHTGTHIDAPSHTEAGGRDIDAFDVGTFAFDARVLSFDTGAREPITTTDLAAALSDARPDGAGEDDAGDRSVEDADCLLLRTGWDACWGVETYLDHPYLAPAAARWCAERGYHVGIDALSVDPTPSERAAADEPSGFEAHHALLGASRFIVENLRGLDRVPRTCTLYAFPLALAGADGAPVRAVAVA